MPEKRSMLTSKKWAPEVNARYVDKNWVKIYTTEVNYEAELLKGLLFENEIDAIIINKKDSSYLFGELELYVQADDVVKAKHVITQHEQL